MIRCILCQECSAEMKLHPDDAAIGWKERRVEIIAQKPDGLGITVTEGGKATFYPRDSLVCDRCDRPIADGQKVVAVTQYRGEEPGPWEFQYARPDDPK